MKKVFDFIVAAAALVALSPIMILCAIAVKLTSPGPVLHLSERIGPGNSRFKLYKFRTMRTDTPQVATHLLTNAQMFLTPIGGFLRRTSLDEFPQLFNVLRGEMSLVGPRPALFNQDDQIELRTRLGCHVLKPGITGWAQVNGRDDISIARKVELDYWYMQNRSLALDLRILALTVVRVLTARGVHH